MKSKKPDTSSLSYLARRSDPSGSGPAEQTPAAGPIEPALPSWKAFVIQLSRDTTPDSGVFAGRIEHLGSGRRRRFASGKELLSMVMRLLHDLDAPSKGQ
jgi:hypothetical protein